MVNLASGILAVLSFVLTVWRWLLAERFPLHRRTAVHGSLPGITFLKPLKGSNAETKRCLQSWFCQKYPGPIQILIGVADENDPVCAVARELQADFPGADARLILCKEQLGANGKVSTLRQLEPFIRHPLVMISDADVEILPDFAAETAHLLTESGAGLVNCFYCLANPSTVAMRWEAVAINADFWTSVLQARALGPVKFALGAVMTTPAATLREIGGFASFADYLADDYELGRRIAESGGKIVFSTAVVDCREISSGWRAVWKHQLRWARTIRACQPLPYFMSILGNATLWPLLWLVVAQNELSAAVFVVALIVRILAAIRQQKLLTGDAESRGFWWLAPMKDMFDILVWLCAFGGNHIDWRGERYRVTSGGKLVKVQTS